MRLRASTAPRSEPVTALQRRACMTRLGLSWIPSRRGILDRLPVILLPILYVIVVYRTAWLADDAFITLRSIDNCVNGYGLRWNVAERVQTYTHPLWMLVLLGVYYVTREPFYTTFAVSIATSVVAFVVALSVARRGGSWASLMVLPLTLSRSFVDYSSAGLENPLTHLLAALFFRWVVAEPGALSPDRRLLRGAIVAGFCYINRQDTILLFAPTLIWLLIGIGERTRVKLRALAIGAIAPFVCTSALFIYYGFVLPNPAYAKLNVEIPRLELLARGLEYIAVSARSDPVSVTCLALAAVVTALRGRALERSLLLGIASYLAYVAAIGGDFMVGRFLSTPVLLSVLLLAMHAASFGRTSKTIFLLGSIGLMLVPKNPIWFSPREYPSPEESRSGNGIVDERLYYFRDASLYHDRSERVIRPWHRRALLGVKRRELGPGVVTGGVAGYFGYFAGPQVHFIDFWGIGDPLLARIPFRPKGSWRMGHFARKVPKGYERAVWGDASQLPNPELSLIYADLLLVTRGRLFAVERWRAMMRLNSGQYRAVLTRLNE